MLDVYEFMNLLVFEIQASRHLPMRHFRLHAVQMGEMQNLLDEALPARSQRPQDRIVAVIRGLRKRLQNFLQAMPRYQTRSQWTHARPREL